MAIIRWNPLGNVSLLQGRINQMFDEAFNRGSTRQERRELFPWKPTVDVYESEQGTVIEADLPGVSKEQIYIEAKDCVLSIRGERIRAAEVPETRYYRQERRYGSFHRSFNLPFALEPSSVSARYKDGVLIIRIVPPESD